MALAPNPQLEGTPYAAPAATAAPKPPAAPVVDPRDPEYYANLAKIQAQAAQEQAALQLEGTQASAMYGYNVAQENAGYGMQTGQASANYEDQLRLAAIDEARAKRNMAEGMIGQGLLRSGYHDRSQRELLQDYNNQLGTWGRNFADANANRDFAHQSTLGGWALTKQQEDARRAATLAAIAQNLGLDTQILGVDAAGRYTAHQQYLAEQQAAMQFNAAQLAQSQQQFDAQQAADAAAAGGGTATTSVQSPTADAYKKAMTMINNKSSYTAAQLAWAVDVKNRWNATH